MTWLTVRPHKRQHLLDDFNAFDSLFEDMFRSFAPLAATTARENSFFAPSIDVKETDTAYELHAELPGLSEDDITLEIEDGVLTLQGEKKAESKDEKGNYTRIERRYGSFKRQFQLPEHVQEENITASFKHGVLTLTLPKQETPKKETKKISIQTH